MPTPTDLRVRTTTLTRTRLLAILTLVALAGAAAPLTRAQGPPALPRVLVLTTGGTIASRGSAGQPSLTAQELVAGVPGMADIARVSVEQFASVASDRVSPVHWVGLARRINAIFRENAADAVVLTHGTDTLEETAYFLNLTVKSDRPVVVVGSMRQASALSSDGPANLLNAVRVGAHPHASGRGVLVLFNDEIHPARDVTKTHTLRLDTFRSRTFGPVGVISSGVVQFYRRVERAHTVAAPFDVSTVRAEDLPRVDIVYVYAGADGAGIDANVARGARGIVMAAVGAGGIAPDQRTAIERAQRQGVVVAVTSHTGSGAVRSKPPGGITGDDLVPQKARILLMLALARTQDVDQIQRWFDEF
jgi:L-asparaginase type II